MSDSLGSVALGSVVKVTVPADDDTADDDELGAGIGGTRAQPTQAAINKPIGTIRRNRKWHIIWTNLTEALENQCLGESTMIQCGALLDSWQWLSFLRNFSKFAGRKSAERRYLDVAGDVPSGKLIQAPGE